MMRLNSRQKQNTWKRSHRMAFWDQPHYQFQEWRKDILQGKNRILTNSIQFMKPIDFIRLIDEDIFIERWIDWRTSCRNRKLRVNCILLDALWGEMVMGSALVKPNRAFLSLTKKQKETYTTVTQYPDPLSMYQLAKATQRHYRRVLDDIKVLVARQLFRKVRSKRNNRTVDLIYTS